MDHRNRSSSSIGTRHGGSRSTARRIDPSRYPLQERRRHPYFRYSRSPSPIQAQQYGSRNLRHRQLYGYARGRNIDPNDDHIIPMNSRIPEPEGRARRHYIDPNDDHIIPLNRRNPEQDGRPRRQNIDPNDSHIIPLNRGRRIPEQDGRARRQNIPVQRDFYATAPPLNRSDQLPNRYRISNPDQGWEINDGIESNVSGEDLRENYVDVPRQENNIQRENRRANRQVNVIQLNIDIHFHPSLPPVEIPAEDYDSSDHEEDEDEEPEERLDNDGLTEQTISDRLTKRIRHKSANKEPEICVVCQSDYEENETLGCLDCGHEYHVDCITKWLLHKNFCPICRRIALLAAEDVEDS